MEWPRLLSGQPLSALLTASDLTSAQMNATPCRYALPKKRHLIPINSMCGICVEGEAVLKPECLIGSSRFVTNLARGAPKLRLEPPPKVRQVGESMRIRNLADKA